MEKANLMLSEMKAANNRRKTIHFDSLPSDISQRPNLSINTRSNIQQLLGSGPISPQASFSTPVSPKTAPVTRPLSMSQDTTSFQSLTHLFSQQAINEALAKTGTHIVSIKVSTRLSCLITHLLYRLHPFK